MKDRAICHRRSSAFTAKSSQPIPKNRLRILWCCFCRTIITSASHGRKQPSVRKQYQFTILYVCDLYAHTSLSVRVCVCVSLSFFSLSIYLSLALSLSLSHSLSSSLPLSTFSLFLSLSLSLSLPVTLIHQPYDVYFVSLHFQ